MLAAIDDSESPGRTLYVAGSAEADPDIVAARFAAAIPAALAPASPSVIPWLVSFAGPVLVAGMLGPAAFAGTASAEAVGVRQNAAATPAMAGAAATAAPDGSLTRADLEWRPKGLLSAKFAPTGIRGRMAWSQIPRGADLQQAKSDPGRC